MPTTVQRYRSLSAYCAAVSKSIICEPKEKREFMRGLREWIADFREEHPEAGIDDVVTCFGTPEMIAEKFVDSITAVDIRKKTRRKRVLVAGVLAVVLSLSVYLVALYVDVQTKHDGMPVYRGVTNESEEVII